LRIDSTGATPTTGTAASFTATTTWQRLNVTQNFTGTPSNIKAVLLISSNNAVIVAWGGQMVAGTTANVYARTVSTNTVPTADGLINNGQAIFIDNTNSTTAYQFQNSSATNVLDIDTVNNRVGINLSNPSYALDVSGDINASGNLRTNNTTRIDSSGNLSNIGSITASGNINTTAGAFQINGTSINTNGTLPNVAYLGQAQTFTGTNTFSASTINLNDSTIATNQSTIAVFNSPTNVTEYQAATSISIGGTSGTLSVRNANTTLGNAAGSGTFTNNGASLYATDALGDLAAGPIGSAASTVDVYTSFSIAPTASGRAYTINAPTANTSYGRAIYLSNIGASGNYFTINSIRIPPGSTATLIWSNTNGGDSWQFAGAGGASIENQNSADQTAVFRISGTGQSSASFLSPLFDSISGGLSIGTATATGVTIGSTTNSTAITLQGAASATYVLGTSNNTGGITIGNSTANNTITIGNSAGSGNTQTISIGTSSTSGSTTAVTIGSTVGSSSTTLKAGSGGINLSAGTIYTAGSYSSGSSSTITQSLVDNNTTITAAATASGLTFTVPSPTTTTSGRLLYVSNNGSNAFIVSYGTGSFSLSVNSTVTLIWNGSSWTTAGSDAGTLQTGYNNSTGGTTPEIKVDSTRGALNIQDADSALNSSLLTVGNSNSSGLGAAILDVQSFNPITDVTNNATNNLVTNGSFEVNVTGWAAKGSASAPAQNTTYKYIGSASSKVMTTAAANDGTSYNVTLSDSTAYTLTFSVRLDPSSISFATLAAGYNNGSSDSNCTLSSTTVSTSGWTTFSCTFTTASSHSGTPSIYIKQTDANIHTFYVDAVQLGRYSILSNASAEVTFTASDWQKKTGSETSVTQVSTQAQDGSNSIQVITTGSTQGTKHNETLNDSTQYNLTFYAKASGSNFSTMEAGYNDGSSNIVCITAQTVVTTGWTAYSCVFTTTSSHSGTPYFYVDQTDATGRTFFLDNFQLSIGTSLGAYREGKISLNGTITSPISVQNQSDSTTAFQVQNAAGANVMVLDSLNKQLKIYENGGSTNYALIYYDTASSTANYTASSGTVAVGTGAGAITITSGSGGAINITGNAASTWKTNTGTLTVQSGTSSDLILNPGSSIVSINGSSVVKLGSSAGDPGTCTLGAIVYNSTTNLFRGCQGSTPAWATLSSTTQTLQQAYTASTGSTTPEVKLDSTRAGLDVQDADSTIGGVLFAVRGSNAGGLGTSILNVNSSNSTVNVGTTANTTGILVLGNDNNSTFNAGAVSNAATEIDGAMFYSSSDHNFLCGTAGKWITCNGLLYSNTSAPSAVNTCTTACAAFTTNAPIPANYCQVGRAIHIIARGVYGLQNVASQTFALGVYYGTDGTTKTNDVLLGTSTSTTSLTNLTNNGWKLDTTIICYDTTHMQTEGDFTYSVSNTAATDAQTVLQTDTATTGTSVTTTSIKNIYLFPAYGASNSANTATLQQLIVTGN